MFYLYYANGWSINTLKFIYVCVFGELSSRTVDGSWPIIISENNNNKIGPRKHLTYLITSSFFQNESKYIDLHTVVET